MHLADEKMFAKSLKKHFKKHPNRKLKIVSAKDPNTIYRLIPHNPKKSLKYYYQVRSNSVHMGKTVYEDYDTVRAALEELLCIFHDILKFSFNIEPKEFEKEMKID